MRPLTNGLITFVGEPAGREGPRGGGQHGRGRTGQVGATTGEEGGMDGEGPGGGGGTGKEGRGGGQLDEVKNRSGNAKDQGGSGGDQRLFEITHLYIMHGELKPNRQ
jgi:hypothetical protein